MTRENAEEDIDDVKFPVAQRRIPHNPSCRSEGCSVSFPACHAVTMPDRHVELVHFVANRLAKAASSQAHAFSLPSA